MIKKIRQEYHQQSKYLFLWNDGLTKVMTASNVFAMIVLKQRNYLQHLLISNMMLLFEFIISSEIS